MCSWSYWKMWASFPMSLTFIWHICFTRLCQVLDPKLICVAKFCNTWWLCRVTEVLRPKLNSEAKLGTAVVLGTVSSLHQRGEEGAEWVGWVSGGQGGGQGGGRCGCPCRSYRPVWFGQELLASGPNTTLWGEDLARMIEQHWREVLIQMGKIMRQFLPLAKSILLMSIIRSGRWNRPSFTSQGPL